ncbi:MAG: prepilin-type N-terminal cleavage/methylation domain-containing protein [Maricaulaceae bacterium]|nr:prepilin-type N-terminal cleavage/methylation domain-containing protein [Maricaulaceae bacterium]
MTPRVRRDKAGFTLVEALAAMLVAASGFAAIYQIYANAARSERAAAETAEGVRLAETLLTEAAPMAGEALTGEAGGWRWRVEATPAAPPFSETLLRIEAAAVAPSGRRMTLAVERAAPAPETPR